MQILSQVIGNADALAADEADAQGQDHSAGAGPHPGGSSPRVIAFPSTRCAIGRTDETARAELLVIAREPETVRKALEPRPLSKSAA
jgi:hypothetical protein